MNSQELFSSYSVTNTNDSGSGSLRQGLLSANLGAPNGVPGSTYSITFGTLFDTAQTITLGSSLPLTFNNVSITGPSVGVTIDGSSAHRGFFFSGLPTSGNGTPQSISTSLTNITLQNMSVTGGASGTGGGGLGAGSAIFVGESANVTLSNVNLSSNQATGGNSTGTSTIRGGGGMGGAGGAYGGGGIRGSGNDGGGGLGGNGGSLVTGDGGGGGFGGTGGGQISPGQFTDSGGNGYNHNNSGGSNAGGGGGGGANNAANGVAGDSTGAGGNGSNNRTGGGGGGGAGGGNGTLTQGGAGGIGGGGGGGSGTGGNGGFGGGGGGSSTGTGGTGGFGGGGGNSGAGGFGGGGGSNATGGFGAGGGINSTPGFGGGTSSSSLGGGGAAMGASIFVSDTGTLTIADNNSLSGGSLTAGTGSGSGQTYGEGIFLTGNGTLPLNPSSGTTQTISDPIADEYGSNSSLSSNKWAVTKNGAGTSSFTGLTKANTYSGGTNINAGVLQVSQDSNLGNGGLLTFGGGTLELTSAFNTNRTVILDSGGGTIQIDTGSSDFSGSFTGTGGLSKTGAGTLIVSNSNNNTYSGTTTVGAGTLQAGAVDSFSPNSAVNMTGGTLDLANYNQTISSLAGSSNVTLGSATLTTGDTTNTTYSGVISGTGGVTKQGTGIFTLSGSNTYSGTTTVGAGTLQGGAVDSFSPNSAVNMTGGTLDLANYNQTILSLAGSSNVTLGSATLTTGDTTNTTYSGVISGTGGVTKQGTGIFTLSGSNTYSGTTTVGAGTLQGGAVDSFSPNSAVNMTGGTLYLANYNQTISSLAGSSNVTLGSATLTTGSATNTTYSGVISGTGGLIKQGAGTFTLSGTNTYSEATTVSAGILQAGAVNSFSPNSGVNMTGGTLDLAGYNQIIPYLEGSSNVTLGSATLTTGNAINTTYSGIISGTGGLIKQGAGTFTLSGANTYSGTTAVNQGTLSVNGSLAGNVSVASGSTLKGTGQISGTATVTGTISPGNSIGTITVGNLDLSSGGTYNAEFNDVVQNDLIQVTNTATLTGGTLLLTLVGLYNEDLANGSFTILTANTINGQFSTLKSSENFKYRVTYTTNSVIVSRIVLPTNNYSQYLPSPVSPNVLSAAYYFDPYASSNVSPQSDLGYVLGELDSYILDDNKAGLASAFEQIQPSQLAALSANAFNSLTQLSKVISLQQNLIRLRAGVREEMKKNEIPEERLEAFNQILTSQKYLSFDTKNILKGVSNAPNNSGINFLQGRNIPVSQRVKFGETNVWFQSYNQLQNMENSLLSAGYSGHTNGGSIGADYEMYKQFYTGFFAGSSHSSFDWRPDRGTGKVQNFYAGIYGTKLTDSGFYIDSQFSLGKERYKSSRNVVFSGVNRSAQSKHNGYHLFGEAEVGQTFLFKQIKVQPFANLSYAFLRENGYNESGANSLDLSVRHRSSNFLRTEVGFSLYKTLIREGTLIRPEFSLSYINSSQIGGNQGKIKSNPVGLPGFFIVQGGNRSINLIAPSLAATAQLPNNLYFIGYLKGELGSKFKSFSAFITMGYNF